jgi:hypothetical protein
MTRALILLLAILAACAPQQIALPEPPAAELPEMPEVAEIPPEEPPAAEEATPQEAPEPAAPESSVEKYETIPVGSGVQCPDGYSFAGGYCVEDACQDKKVKCMVSGNLIKRPDCECWIYLGEPICSIKAAEETRVKSLLCQRKGQAGAICGAYDSNKGHCVLD